MLTVSPNEAHPARAARPVSAGRPIAGASALCSIMFRNRLEGRGRHPAALLWVSSDVVLLRMACPVPGTTLCSAPFEIVAMFQAQSS